MELPFEREAYEGAPPPAGLGSSDLKAYLALRYLYRMFKRGDIERDEASKIKKRIIKAWEHDKWIDGMGQYHVRLIKALELAVSDYLKDKTLEKADRFIRLFDGMEKPGEI